MFFFTYLRRELRRRAGRTFVTSAGLAVGVALVVAITAISAGLDRAQAEVLDPLASVGTDLLVTRPVETGDPASGGGQANGATTGGFRFGGPGSASGLSPEDQQALLAENQSVLTDLSKLGEPGEPFVHDFFLPATQLTFPAEETGTVAGLEGVAEVSQGLTLLAQHQEGTVPEIVAEFQTGGEEIEIDEEIAPLTEEEQAAVDECLAEAGVSLGSRGSGPGSGGQPPAAGGRGFGGALRQCMPERFSRFQGRVTTPERTLTQVLNPPETDITTETYTVAGVDPASPDLGLITPAQVVDGAYFSTEARMREAVLAQAYAARKGLEVGSELTLNDATFTVVGLAQPPLGGQAADVYLPLGELQTLAGREGRANTLLVRADSAADVADLAGRIEAAFPGATVTSAEELAGQVSGSLVDAASLADRLGKVLAFVVLAAAFLVAVLLTLAAVSKRVRELGTLKAIGWSQRLVVRQVLGESLVQGLFGGLLGAGLGVGGAALAAHLSPSLQASAPSSGPQGVFGLGQIASGTVDTAIRLTAPVDAGLLALAVLLAVLGGLVAGGAGALRAARLRPAAAMRELG